MAELIAGLVEAIAGLVLAFCEALPAILELLFYVVAASVTLVAYAVSPRFREKKRKEWQQKPSRKYLDLGVSTFCLALLTGLATWIAWPAPPPAISPETVDFERQRTNEDVRFTLKRAGRDATNEVTIAVKKGGAKKIMETESIKDLGKALRENVTVIRRATNGPPTPAP